MEQADPTAPASTSRDPRLPRPINGLHIFLAMLLGITIAFALGYIDRNMHERPSSTQDQYDIARTLVFALAAVGALPAAYIGYRRQKNSELQRQLDRERHDHEKRVEATRLQEVAKADARYQETEVRRLEELAATQHRDDERNLHERFSYTAGQLGNAKSTVRLASIYTLAELADQWTARGELSQRQVCLDLMCAHVRMPLPEAPEMPGRRPNATPRWRCAKALFRIIREHLQPDSEPS